MSESIVIKNKFDRRKTPPPIRLTDRDIELIQAIQNYGGFLTLRHIENLFFGGRTTRTMERRLSTLFHNYYLERPTLTHRRTKPIPEAIYWLGWKGILTIAAMQGIDVEEPKRVTPNRIKQLEKQLRSVGIPWLVEPHWVQLLHDIKVMDVRLAFEEAISKLPFLSLANCVNERDFRADHDKVSVDKGKQSRGVIPDLYLMLINEQKRTDGDTEHKAHLLFEVDLATRDNPRFEREKLQAYASYIGSSAFKDRFESESGSWLIITTGRKRMINLIRQVAKIPDNRMPHFYFSTFRDLEKTNPLTTPIWWKAGKKEPMSLISENETGMPSQQLVYKAEN